MNAAAQDAHLSSLLHRVGLKSTTSRIIILKFFFEAKDPVCIKGLYEKLSKKKVGINMVTIYRTVELLCKKNIIHRVNFTEEAAYYKLSDGKHDSHHITCTNCKKRESVDYCVFSKCEKPVLNEKLLFSKITGHMIEYFGSCKKCDVAASPSFLK